MVHFDVWRSKGLVSSDLPTDTSDLAPTGPNDVFSFDGSHYQYNFGSKEAPEPFAPGRLAYFTGTMAIKAPITAQLAPDDRKQLHKLGRALGRADNSVQLVTYDSEEDVLAVFVDAVQDKSQHEGAVIQVWIEWLPKVDERLEFRLFNLSEFRHDRSKKEVIAAYQGEVLFDRR